MLLLKTIPIPEYPLSELAPVAIEPDSYDSNPATHLIRVDLPDPEYPIMDTSSFLPTVRDTLSSALAAPNDFVIWFILIILECFIINKRQAFNYDMGQQKEYG